MTYQPTALGDTIPRSNTMRQPRLYGLFRRVTVTTKAGKPKRVYIRESASLAFRKDVAVRVFQNALLAGMYDGVCRELRPLAKGMFGQ